MRRSFTLASVFVAALTLAWSASPVSAVASVRAPFLAHTDATTTPAIASTPTQLQSFPGIGEQASIAAAGAGNPNAITPADPSVAAGATDVVEAVNDAVVVFNRATGVKLATFNLNLLVRTSAGWAVKYPHVIYDPISGHFIIAVLQYNLSRSGCSNDGTQIEVVVSTADPTAAWQAPRTFNNEAVFAGSDQPVATNVSLGMTSTVVDITWDYTDCLNTAPTQSQTDIIQRADLAAGTLGVNSARFFAGGPAGVQPAMALGLSSVEYQVANDVNCTVHTANSFAVFSISGTPDALNVSPPVCAATATEPNGSSVPPAAPQAGTSTTLQTNDDRILDVVWGANTLWATGNTGCTPSGDASVRSCINVVSATASTTGTVSGASQLTPKGVNGQYLYYPSLAVDTLTPNDVFVTFDESSSSTLESTQLATISGGSTWSSFSLVHSSAVFYGPAGCTTCSWGDFSTAVQDPLHPTDVWVVSEDIDGDTGTGCATANTCWDTFIARYTFAGPSVISLTPSSGTGSGGQVVTVSGSDFAPGTTATLGGSPITISNLTPDSFTFTTPPGPPAGGLVFVVASDSLGSSNPTAPGAGYLYVPLSNYTPLTPFRIFDTRNKPPTPLGPNTTRIVQVTGVPGNGTTPVPSTAVAVVINVTEVDGTAASLLTAYPTGTPQPKASNLNFNAGTVTPNLVTVTLGSLGRVSIYNSVGTVNVIVDVEGYFAPPSVATPAGEFHPILPLRVCDTRSTSGTPACKAHGVLVAGSPMLVTVTGTGAAAIPSDGTAEAAVLNLTAVSGTLGTFLTVYPTSSSGTCPDSAPVSTINVVAGAVEANRVFVKLGPGPSGPNTAVCVLVSVGKINVLLDANGWFGSATAATGFQYQAIAPSRICDTRGASIGCSAGAIGAGAAASRLVHVAGEGGVPSIASGTVVQAVIANMTAVMPTANTFMVAYAAGTTTGASDLNLVAGATLPNLVVVQLSTTAGANDGCISVLNSAGTVNAIIDIEGWFQ